jgi:signal transduction histidine kinase/CheY-like chemotaxis protein
LKKLLTFISCLVFLPVQPAVAAEEASFFAFSPWLPLAAGLLIVVCWLGLRLRCARSENRKLLTRLHIAEQAFAQAPLPIYRIDAGLVVVEANQCAVQSSGRPTLTGASLFDLEPELAAHPAILAWQSVKGERIPITVGSGQQGVQESGGHGALVRIAADEQEQLFWFGATPDSSKQLQSFGSATTQAEESANRMKSEFIANINHEVRTPMNAIIGYTEMLANSELGPKEKRFVGIIHRSSMALVSIFNDIMELSKIDSGRLQIMFSSVRLPMIVAEVESLFKDLAEEKGLRLHCRMAKHLPQSYILDGVRLKQVLQNLVSNAVKFTNEGSVELLVDGAPTPGKEKCYNLQFIVQDTGIGIPPRDQQKIFELFRQREDAITRQYGGVGLGLTLCSRLTAMMGGWIELSSKEGEGARFTVFLNDIGLAHQAAAELAFENGASLEQERKLLVVDDVDLIKDVFIDFFQDSPYRVFTATNGEDALALAVAEQPAIIFMDLNLSGTNGRNVTEQLRRTAETASIPVVVMTGEMLEEADYRPLFDDFLQKPFRLETLKEIVARHARTGSGNIEPQEAHDNADGDERFMVIWSANAWNAQLERLRIQAVRSGSLGDAASLGMAMKETGETASQSMLAELGAELMQYANEPNILGVDRLLARLSKAVERNKP